MLSREGAVSSCVLIAFLLLPFSLTCLGGAGDTVRGFPLFPLRRTPSLFRGTAAKPRAPLALGYALHIRPAPRLRRVAGFASAEPFQDCPQCSFRFAEPPCLRPFLALVGLRPPLVNVHNHALRE